MNKPFGGRRKTGWTFNRSAGNLHRIYVGLRDGSRYALLLYSSTDEEMFKAQTKEVEALVDSWDFSGQFPGSKEERKE